MYVSTYGYMSKCTHPYIVVLVQRMAGDGRFVTVSDCARSGRKLAGGILYENHPS